MHENTFKGKKSAIENEKKDEAFRKIDARSTNRTIINKIY